MQSQNLASRAAHWSAGHRKTAIFGWLAFVVIAFVLAGAVGPKTIADEDSGNGESKRGRQGHRRRRLPRRRPTSRCSSRARATVKVGDPQFTAAVDDVVARLEARRRASTRSSPRSPRATRARSPKDGRSALVTFEIPGDDDVADERVDATLAATAAAQKAHPDLRIEQFGDASADKAISARPRRRLQAGRVPRPPDHAAHPDRRLRRARRRRRAAAARHHRRDRHARPGRRRSARSSRWRSPSSSVILLIGLAVGVDYSMFYLRRKMEERDAGRSPEAALEFAAATSGQAVLDLRPDRDDRDGRHVPRRQRRLHSRSRSARSSSSPSRCSASVTVLPAVLSKLGDNVEKGRVPFIGRMRHRNHGESRVWGWVIDRVLAPPGGVASIAAGGLLVALALPALNMHTVNPGVAGPAARPRRSCRPTTASRPRSPAARCPAIVVVQADDVTTPEVQAGIKAMSDKALATGQMSEPVTTDVSPDKTVAIVIIPLHGNGTDDVSDAALATLRDNVDPGDDRQGRRRRGQRDRHDRRLEGLQRRDEVAPADRVRVRARPGVPAAARHVPHRSSSRSRRSC